ncbi:MAG: putative hydrolase of HD superfamily [Candidatus Latescibacterota bacterium]|jgi:putative hydrolase of HD superfamily
MATDRLEEQMAFILEVEGLKQIFRQTLLPGDKRPENDAEHSWHLSLMAIVLTEHARVPDLDLLQVLKMVLIHDIVEIDAGDTFAYDTVGHEDKEEREKAAADRLFNLLPEEQALEVRALWDEFEERVTPEAQYAAALDRLQPLLLNFHTEGAAWRRHGVKKAQVIARNEHIGEGAPALWQYARQMIDKAVECGYLQE